jgi:hypothetical protein
VILESMYRPTEKDRLSGLQQRRFVNRQTMTTNSATVTFDFPVTPIDTCRIITSMSMNLEPTVALFIEAASFKLFGLSAQELCLWEQSPPQRVAGAVNVRHAVTLSVEIWMFPGDFIRAAGFFSAAGAGNTIVAGIHGFDVPRANLF